MTKDRKQADTVNMDVKELPKGGPVSKKKTTNKDKERPKGRFAQLLLVIVGIGLASFVCSFVFNYVFGWPTGRTFFICFIPIGLIFCLAGFAKSDDSESPEFRKQMGRSRHCQHLDLPKGQVSSMEKLSCLAQSCLTVIAYIILIELMRQSDQFQSLGLWAFSASSMLILACVSVWGVVYFWRSKNAHLTTALCMGIICEGILIFCEYLWMSSGGWIPFLGFVFMAAFIVMCNTQYRIAHLAKNDAALAAIRAGYPLKELYLQNETPPWSELLANNPRYPQYRKGASGNVGSLTPMRPIPTSGTPTRTAV